MDKIPEPIDLNPKFSFTCPKCHNAFGVLETVSEAEGATMDCPECNALLICKDGVATFISTESKVI